MNRWIGLVLVGVLGVSLSACGGSKKPGLSADEGGAADVAEGGHRGHGDAEKPADVPRPEGPIKINEVTVDELVAYKVPGLAQASAQNIITYRDEHGPFRSMEDLDKAPRMGESMLAKLKEVGVDFGAAASSAPAADAAPAASATAASAAPATGASSTAAASAPGAKVNINTATLVQLQDLKGVGAATAQKILDYRTAHGPFKTIDELDEVSGIGPAKIDGFRSQVVLR